jgi:hypothetical protein
MGAAKLFPEQTRAQDSLFVSQCSLSGLQPSLPLKWPIPADMPARPRRVPIRLYLYLALYSERSPAGAGLGSYPTLTCCCAWWISAVTPGTGVSAGMEIGPRLGAF